MAKSNWTLIRKKKTPSRNRDVYEDQQLERSELMQKQTPTSRVIFTAIISVVIMIVVYVVWSLGQMAVATFGNDSFDRFAEETKSTAVTTETSVNTTTAPTEQTEPTSPYSYADNWDSVTLRKKDGTTVTVYKNSLPKYDYSPSFLGDQYIDEYGFGFTVKPTWSSYVELYESQQAKPTESVSNNPTASTSGDTASEPVPDADGYFENPNSDRTSDIVFTVTSKTSGAPVTIMHSRLPRYKKNADGGFTDEYGFNFGQIPTVDNYINIYIKDPSNYMANPNNGVYKKGIYGKAGKDYEFTLRTDRMSLYASNKGLQGSKALPDTVIAFSSAMMPRITKLPYTEAYLAKKYKDAGIIAIYQDELGFRFNMRATDASEYPTWERYYGTIYYQQNKESINFWYFMKPTGAKVGGSFMIAIMVFFIMFAVMMKNLEAQNVMADTTDINQYKNDQHIQLPEEVQQNYDFFPDTGAHSSVQVSSMISHVMLTNKGIKQVEVTSRAAKDEKDKEGNITYYKGEAYVDDNGNLIKETKPMFDMNFADDLFKTSNVDKASRAFYDPKKISYNPGNENRDKQKGFDTVADLINNDWVIPEYETQRPAGAYIVDTAPVNTMVLAITRAGKGQTYIEPTIDMWTREKRQNNAVINDPKGELLVKFYVPATVRGYQIVQFNLITPLKTDVYNPLGLAADAAREGDFIAESTYIKNIADVFFPVDGSDDPVWPNAANNAFTRTAYGLIDYYLEEEAELRLLAKRNGMDEKTLNTKIDNMWGKVTLYNCYQLFVILSSKKKPNPSKAYNAKIEQQKAARDNGAELPYSNEELAKEREIVEKEKDLWENKPEIDLLTLFFNATDKLPKNEQRKLVGNSDKSLRAMAGAEKMLASVYGIAITAMSFFTDPTISRLTSGTLSQNVDLGGLSFPRRGGIRFNLEFVKKLHLMAMQVKWSCYKDSQFTEPMDKTFEHTDMIKDDGWAKFYFEGIFPKDTAYIKCEVRNPQTQVLIKVFYFKFTKNYQTSLDGTRYIKDPVLGTKIVKNGVLTEMVQNKKGKFVDGISTFTQKRIVDFVHEPIPEKVQTPIITQTLVRYSEKPKMVFLVTPPHLMGYAKLILILIKQLVDLNFAGSYTTKENQKPLYKTRYMLDELGNLQSEGHGISNFQTMLSIGLGQDQQFTLILQTLQQLKDVYGDSVDKIVQGNAQPLDAKIMTPDGYKLMGEVEVGDEVLTPDGKVTSIEGIYPRGVRKVYNVTRRDGSTTRACNEHLWKVQISDEDYAKLMDLLTDDA